MFNNKYSQHYQLNLMVRCSFHFGGNHMKISARNQLKGTVIDIKEGAVNGVVTIDVDGNKLVADITMDSIKNLGLEIGKEAYAVIKASSVMVAVD